MIKNHISFFDAPIARLILDKSESEFLSSDVNDTVWRLVHEVISDSVWESVLNNVHVSSFGFNTNPRFERVYE